MGKNIIGITEACAAALHTRKTKAVVTRPLIGITQDIICFGGFFEFLFLRLS